MRVRKIAMGVGVFIVVLLVIAVAGIFLFTNTDWGRERTRRVLVSIVGGAFHGILHVGELQGNLLSGAILRDVSLTDSAGGPFFQAQEVHTRYTILPLLEKRLYFDHVTVIRPRIILDRPPGGIWNFDRIIPRDTTHKGGPPGYGSWIRLTNVTMIDGYILSRGPWGPDASLTKHQRDSVVAYTLGPAGRQNIVRVPGGFQRIAEFHDATGTFPLLQIADPNDPTQTISVSSLSMLAFPMRPPAVQVRDVQGRFLILHDSLFFHGINAKLAGSRLSGDGRYNIDNNDLRLRLHSDLVATNDLLWIDPAIPHNGVGSLNLALDWVGQSSDYQATNAALRVAGAKLSGKLGVLVKGDTLVYHNTNMRVAHLDTRTIAQLFPTLKSPRQGFLTGRAAVAGSLSRLRVDGDIAFDDPQSGRSRIVAKGTLGATKSAFLADSLHVAVLPFQVGLGRVFMPTLPIGGTVTGNAILNGSTVRGLAVQADVTHTDVTGPSHVTGKVIYTAGPQPWMNADVQLLPLSLATVGTFAPAAGLHGTVAGPVRVTGPLNHLVLDAALTTPDSGSVTARGTADLASKDKSYDVAVTTHLFNASSISDKAPPTLLTADAALHGHGATAETIDATLAANVQTSLYDSLAIDSARVRVRATNGTLHVDTLALRIPHAAANIHGDFGLTAAHNGSILYTVAIDSLGTLSRFFPKDSGVVRPRPGILRERLTRAEQDSARIAQATVVQRAISGQPGPTIAVDTPGTVQRSALLGAVQASGTVTGNVRHFNIDGTAHGQNVVALGNSAVELRASYTGRDVLAPTSYFGAGIYGKGISVSGFAVDSLSTQGSYQQQRGNASLRLWQGTNHSYDVSGAYVLNRARNDIQLSTLRLRFDTTVYAIVRPTALHFSSSELDIDTLDIRSAQGNSRIFANGKFPFSGSGNAPINGQFDLTNFDVGNIAALLESDVPVKGLVSVDAVAGGTAANPTLRAAFGTARVTYAGTVVPEVHGTASYADQVLHTKTDANLEGKAPFLHESGTIPINLAVTGVTGSRIPTDRAIAVRVDADSLPLEHMPEVTDAVTDLKGFATLHAEVTGTVAHPNAAGRLALLGAGMNVVPAGIKLDSMYGSVRLVRDSVIVDSVAARSGGPIRLAGTIGIAPLTDPTFNLKLLASNAHVLGGDHGDLYADASLSLTGKMSGPTAQGDIRLLRGVIQIPEPSAKQLVSTNDPSIYSVLDSSSADARALFPSQSPLLRNLRANAKITIDRDVFVRTSAANVEIYTEDPLTVTANMRRQSFLVDGVALSDRGEYRYQGRRFIVRRGSVIFINTRQLDPSLQITGEYTVQLPGREPITIQIVISGTLNSPKIALTSDADPPISQTDLLSYLAFGQTSSSLLQSGGSGLTTGGSGSGNIVGRAAALAQQQVGSAALGALSDQVAGQAAHALGADVFDITPADVSVDVGNFLRATQIEFGKYIQSRMYVGFQVRPDPASLQRPGFEIQEILDPRRGYTLTASLSPRYLLQEPSLSEDPTPTTTSAFGLFLTREWRY